MTDCTAAPVRRGSIVWRERRAWLVWDVRTDSVVAFPIRRAPGALRTSDVPIEQLPDQLLARVTGPAVVRVGCPCSLGRSALQYGGEFSAVCRISATIARLAAAARDERRWGDEKVHRRRARAEKSAV